MAFCMNCGNQLPDGSRFCGNCGAQQGTPAVAMVQQAGQSVPASNQMQKDGIVFTRADVIDYEIFGDDMQLVEIELDPGESVLAEAGAMNYMDARIKMETIFGDGSGADANKGLGGKLLSAGKRALTGEGLFMTVFQNTESYRRLGYPALHVGYILRHVAYLYIKPVVRVVNVNLQLRIGQQHPVSDFLVDRR